MLAVAVACPLLLGAAAAEALGIARREDGLAWSAWSLALGCGLLGALVFVAWVSPLTIPAGAVAVVLASLVGSAALSGAARRRAAPRAPVAATSAWTRAARGERALFWLALTLVLACAFDLILDSSARAACTGDEGHIWSAKAKAMLIAGGPGDGFAALLSRHGANHHEWAVAHADYPLLNPLLQMWTFQLTGSFAVAAGRVCVQMFALAGLLALSAGLRRHARPALAAALLVLVASAEPFRDGLSNACGDGMLVASTALACEAWLRARTDSTARPRAVVAWGAALALGAWTKNEGVLIALAFGAAALVTARGERRRVALALLPAAGVAAFTFAFNAAHGLSNDLIVERGEPFWTRAFEHAGERAVPVADYLAREVLLDSSASRLLWLAIALSAVALARLPRTGALLAPALACAAVLAGYAFVFLGTPWEPAYHLRTAAARIAFHVLPAGAIWLAAATSELRVRADSP